VRHIAPSPFFHFCGTIGRLPPSPPFFFFKISAILRQGWTRLRWTSSHFAQKNVSGTLSPFLFFPPSRPKNHAATLQRDASSIPEINLVPPPSLYFSRPDSPVRHRSRLSLFPLFPLPPGRLVVTLDKAQSPRWAIPPSLGARILFSPAKSTQRRRSLEVLRRCPRQLFSPATRHK